MTRQTKTPRQRAEEALGVAERRHEKAVANLHRLSDQVVTARAERDEAHAFLVHAQQHPALQPAPTEASTSSTTTQEEGTRP